MSKTTHQAEFIIDGALKSTFNRSFIEATTKVGTLQQKINNFQQSKVKTEALESSFIKLRERTQDLSYKWHAAAAKVKQLNEVITTSNNVSRTQQQELANVQKKADSLHYSLINLRGQQKNVELEMRAQSRTTHELGKEYGFTTKKVKDYQLALDRLQKSAKLRDKSERYVDRSNQAMAFGRNAMHVSRIMLKPLHDALEIEKMGAQVRKNIHFHDIQEYQDYQKKWFAISEKLTVGQHDILHMAEQAAAGNFSKGEIEAAIITATKMSNVLGMSFEDAMQKQIEWKNGMGKTQQEINSLTDAMVTLGDKSSVKAEWLATFTAQAGAQAKAVGLAAEQLMAYGSAITGMAPEAAATGFKAVAESLGKGVYATKSQAEAFSKLGLNVTTVAKNMQKDAVGTINMVLDAMDKVPKHEQSALSAKLVGATGSPVLAQFLSNRALINKQLDITSNKANYEGRLDKEADIVNQSTLNKLEMMKNSLANIQLTLAEALLPSISVLVDKIKLVVDTVKPWIDENKGLLSILTKIAAVLAGVTIVVSGMSWLFSGAMAIGIKAIASAIWLWNSAILANPMTWIIAGVIVVIGTLSYGIYQLVKHWDDVTAAVKKFGGWLDDILTKFNPLYNMGKKLSQAFSWVGSSGDKNVNVNVAPVKNLDNELKGLQSSKRNNQQSNMNYTFSPNITFNGDADPQNIEQILNKYGQSGQSKMHDFMNENVRFAN